MKDNELKKPTNNVSSDRIKFETELKMAQPEILKWNDK